jgi:hypothetical protein
VSRLAGRDDADLHYEDGSHRWLSPDGAVSDEAWRGLVDTHLQLHRAEVEAEGGPVRYALGLTPDPDGDDELLGGFR